jgi:Flp pilus assembly protein TadB
MRLRVVLIALLVAATAAFVVGVSIERSQGEAHAEPTSKVVGAAGEAGHEEGAENGQAVHAEESPGAHAEEGNTERFLGIDYEAVPFIVLAAAFSVALAAAVWLLPGSVWVLALVVVAMLAFAVLDVREVVHQLDEDNGGLALLAGVVAALHLGAAAVALALARGPGASSPQVA